MAEAVTVSDSVPPRWTVPSIAALTMIVVAPPCWCVWVWQTGWRLLFAGGLLWGASVALKGLLFPGLNRAAELQPIATRAAWQGSLSAAFELGAAAVYFAFVAHLSLSQVAAFGIGAGCTEAAYVLGLGLFGPKPSAAVLETWMRGARLSWCVRYSIAAERLFAVIGHSGSRGLIYVGLNTSSAFAAGWIAAAFLLFALIDGVAVYGHLRDWNWFDPAVCRRSHLLFSSASVAEAILFVVAFEQASGGI